MRGEFPHLLFTFLNKCIHFFFPASKQAQLWFVGSMCIKIRKHRGKASPSPHSRGNEGLPRPGSMAPLGWLVVPGGQPAPPSSPQPSATPKEGGHTKSDTPTPEAEALTLVFSSFESSLSRIKIFS